MSFRRDVVLGVYPVWLLEQGKGSKPFQIPNWVSPGICKGYWLLPVQRCYPEDARRYTGSFCWSPGSRRRSRSSCAGSPRTRARSWAGNRASRSPTRPPGSRHAGRRDWTSGRSCYKSPSWPRWEQRDGKLWDSEAKINNFFQYKAKNNIFMVMTVITKMLKCRADILNKRNKNFFLFEINYLK